jgi:hypothetical protein
MNREWINCLLTILVISFVSDPFYVSWLLEVHRKEEKLTTFAGHRIRLFINILRMPQGSLLNTVWDDDGNDIHLQPKPGAEPRAALNDSFGHGSADKLDMVVALILLCGFNNEVGDEVSISLGAYSIYRMDFEWKMFDGEVDEIGVVVER